MNDVRARTLVLGIGNVLMGDEGVGVAVVRGLETVPPGVVCLDGGTGGFALLDAMGRADRVILVDATADGQPPGTLTRLEPRFSEDYPRRLTAHDIGLKDLLDAFYLLGDGPSITLFAVSIEFPQSVGIGLSEAMRRELPRIIAAVRKDLDDASGVAKAGVDRPQTTRCDTGG